MKKSLAMIIVLVMSVAILAACTPITSAPPAAPSAPSAPSAPAPSAPSAPAPSAPSAPAPSKPAPVVQITAAHHLPTEGIVNKIYEKLAEEAAANSNGAIEVVVSPAAQLGGQREILEAVNLGTIEMGHGEAAQWLNYLPKFSLVQMPFLFADSDHFYKFWDGEIGRGLVNELMDITNFKLVMGVNVGERNVYSSKPLSGMSDLKGLKIRTPESPAYVNTFTALGANPTPVPAPEMYSAMQTGVVDAMEGTFEVAYTYKINEVGKNSLMTRHFAVCDADAAVNKNFYASLSADNQKAFDDACKAAEAWGRGESSNFDALYIKKLEEVGVKFVKIDDYTPFVNAVQPVYAQFAADIKGGKELLDAVMALK